jgi:predicted nuclease of predicted toxin-antitoxin system
MPAMLLLIDENVPASVAQLFADRAHDVRFVRNILPAGTPDPVIATVGDRLSAVVVTRDRDFESLVKRVPKGNGARFRKLGRISFRCNEVRGRENLEKWIGMIEYHYSQALNSADIRMIVQIQDSGVKFM